MTTINKFSQVCVWPGTVVGSGRKIAEFEAFMQKNFGVRVKYLEEIKTLPDKKKGEVVEGTGNRNDLFFSVHSEDINKFAVARLKVGIRWIEDVLANEAGPSVYPIRVQKI